MDDQVLSLSTFGEIIEDPEKKKVTSDSDELTFGAVRKMSTKDNQGDNKKDMSGVNHVAKKALEHASQIKLMHWQTNSYAEHKALDKMFGNLVDLTDTLLESIMGKFGRPQFEGNCDMSICNYSEELPISYMKDMRNCYENDCKGHFSKETDAEIINIIDEILAVIDKTQYLLSLK